MSDSASRWAPRCAEPRNAWPSTSSSVRTVSRPSWLLPLNRPVCRPYVVAGISVQANRVSVTSVIFTGKPPFDSSIHRRASAGGTPAPRRRRRAHRSARRQVRPQRVGAALGDRASELDRPVALAAELGAPRPEASRHELQRVLVREADGAVGLMGDRRAHARPPAAWPTLTLAAAISTVASPRSAARNALAAAVPAAAVCPARTARFCWITWKEPIGFPNCRRSVAYCAAWRRR